MARTLRILSALIVLTAGGLTETASAGQLQAGAAIVDVTPQVLPVLVNGGMMSRSIEQVKTSVQARAVALADGDERVVIVVVDSCMMSREFLDDAKALAHTRTDLPTDRMLISATHTHSAPASMGCLGTDADPAYVPFLRDRIAEVIERAIERLEPARIGFGKIDAAEFTALRRWIRRPDKIDMDPFGNQTVRANMHSARNLDDVTGESGPEDPDLSLIAFQSLDGRPLAAIANFSMHYYGDQNLSADYFGLFCDGLQSYVRETTSSETPFVAIMSHGCSGDIWRRDYRMSAENWNNGQATIDEFAEGLQNRARRAWDALEYEDADGLQMAEQRMTLRYRVPDAQRLQWARQAMSELDSDTPKTREQVYAREQILLHERQQTEIVVQALRIGNVAIATTPNETYALTGLKIKARSPLANTIVIELANGGDGYIPPPEQHLLGGYNTWAARSAGLEVDAEPRIAEACVLLLEEVSDMPRRTPQQSRGPAAESVAKMNPTAWYRMDEFEGPIATDSSGGSHHAVFDQPVTYYLEGPSQPKFTVDEPNRAVMFAGGRLRASLAPRTNDYSVSMWIWNGMPGDARGVTGWLLSHGFDGGVAEHSLHVGLGGTTDKPGRLILQQGQNENRRANGMTEIPRWTWQHVAITCGSDEIQVYLNGTLEVSQPRDVSTNSPAAELFIGGRSDSDSNWEGRLDEIAVFDRALTSSEIQMLSRRDP